MTNLQGSRPGGFRVKGKAVIPAAGYGSKQDEIMADQWQSFTNKKLHFARLQLDAWDDADNRVAGSYREAYLFHAVSAYKSLIAEVMEAYGVSVTSLPGLTMAMEQLGKEGRQSSELEQMKNMEAGSDWLPALLAAFAEVSELASVRSVSQDQSQGLIAVVNPEDMKIDTVAEGRGVLSCLKKQVEYIRNMNVEY